MKSIVKKLVFLAVLAPIVAFLFLVFSFLFISPGESFAQSRGQVEVFYVDPDFYIQEKERISAILEEKSERALFYIEKSWLENLSQKKKEDVKKRLEDLGKEFDQIIYPKLRDFYGQEWSPGIDDQVLITVLFHQTKNNARGYFREVDEYKAIQAENSNEREMVYLDVNTLFNPNLPSFLAHELVHLITFNQKNRLRGVQEDVWLNELRAEYAPTFLGYDNNYQGSNLQLRVKDFLSSPSDSLISWDNKKRDYGLVNLFGQYLVDHYGKDLLSDSLRSSLTGIASLENSLKKMGINKDLSEIFSDWSLAVLLNDCSFNPDYCYRNKNIKDFTITPSLIFLPSTQKTQVYLNYSLQPWAGNWYRIIGGEGKLRLGVEVKEPSCFSLPLVLTENSQKTRVCSFFGSNPKSSNSLTPCSELGDIISEKPSPNKSVLYLGDFNKNWLSLTLVPINFCPDSKNFSLSISLEQKTAEQEEIEALKARIDLLKAKILELKARIAQILRQRISCSQIKTNLFFGMKGKQVLCLQQFLREQGPDVYPESLVTGWFGPLTRQAVIRFQERYASEILTPLGLQKGTGFVGSLTRGKINEILKGGK